MLHCSDVFSIERIRWKRIWKFRTNSISTFFSWLEMRCRWHKYLPISWDWHHITATIQIELRPFSHLISVHHHMIHSRAVETIFDSINLNFPNRKIISIYYHNAECNSMLWYPLLVGHKNWFRWINIDEIDAFIDFLFKAAMARSTQNPNKKVSFLFRFDSILMLNTPCVFVLGCCGVVDGFDCSGFICLQLIWFDVHLVARIVWMRTSARRDSVDLVHTTFTLSKNAIQMIIIGIISNNINGSGVNEIVTCGPNRCVWCVMCVRALAVANECVVCVCEQKRKTI